MFQGRNTEISNLPRTNHLIAAITQVYWTFFLTDFIIV